MFTTVEKFFSFDYDYYYSMSSNKYVEYRIQLTAQVTANIFKSRFRLLP